MSFELSIEGLSKHFATGRCRVSAERNRLEADGTALRFDAVDHLEIGAAVPVELPPAALRLFPDRG